MTGLDALERFSEPWSQLVYDREANPSLHPNWLKASLQSQGLADDLRLLIAWEGSSMVGVLPYLVREEKYWGVPLDTIDLANNVLSYHHEVVARAAHEELIEALLAGPDLEDWQVFRVVGVEHGGETARALRAVGSRKRRCVVEYPSVESPFLPIEGTWESYLSRRSRNFRYNLNRKRRSLDQLGRWEVRWSESEGDVPRLIEDILAIERESWKVSAGMAISGHADEERYYRLLLPVMARNGWLYASTLCLSGRPIAYSLCYRAHGRIGQLKTSFVEEHAGMSPGFIVTAAAIERAFSERCVEFDFLGDVMAHKLSWTERSRRHVSYFVFNSRPLPRAMARAKQLVRRIRSRLAPISLASRTLPGAVPSSCGERRLDQLGAKAGDVGLAVGVSRQLAADLDTRGNHVRWQLAPADLL